MDAARYVTMADEERAPEVLRMMKDFYAEVEADPGLDPTRFPDSIRYLTTHQDHGRIILIFDGSELCGYAIIIQHWSNEYGGVLLLVDELYVAREFRHKGFGRGLFELLKRERPWGARTMMLEVAHKNPQAQRLYTSVGFKEKGNALMTLRLH